MGRPFFLAVTRSGKEKGRTVAGAAHSRRFPDGNYIALPAALLAVLAAFEAAFEALSAAFIAAFMALSAAFEAFSAALAEALAAFSAPPEQAARPSDAARTSERAIDLVMG